MDDVDRSAHTACTALQFTHTHARTHTPTYLHGYLHKRFYAVPPQQASLHALHLRVRERVRKEERCLSIAK